MRDPGDVSQLRSALKDSSVQAAEIVAVIGKTEGNGGVNDFTRAYFTQSLMLLLSQFLNEDRDTLVQRIPCVFSGGTEGVLSPHYMVFCRSLSDAAAQPEGAKPSLAIGTAFSPRVPAAHIGRRQHVESVKTAVQAAMADAQIEDPDDVHLVQVKVPCLTAARVAEEIAQGEDMAGSQPGQSMALARACGALGVALALGDIAPELMSEGAMLNDRSLFSTRASISAGVEVACNEVILLGNSPRWSGPLQIRHRPMQDALDIGAIYQVLDDLQIGGRPQVTASEHAKIAGVLVKGEPDRRGSIRGHRHTMLDDTDIDPQRHLRGALGGLVAGVFGDSRIFISGGAEHQGPDGGGLIAVIAHTPSDSTSPVNVRHVAGSSTRP
jgi:cyanuric acid amidohydrolase